MTEACLKNADLTPAPAVLCHASRHCEGRSPEAIQLFTILDCFADARKNGSLFENADLSLPLQPFGRAPPQRVAVFSAKESEMTDRRRADIGGGDRENFRRRRRESRTEKLDCRPRRPGVVGETKRAQRACICGESRERVEGAIVEHRAF